MAGTLDSKKGKVVCSCGNVIQRYDAVGDVPLEHVVPHPACGREPGEDLAPAT